MVDKLSYDEIEWELIARGFDPDNINEGNARSSLIMVIDEGVSLEPVEGNLEDICKIAMALCEEVKNNVEKIASSGEDFFQYMAKIKHLENRLQFTSDYRDPKRSRSNKILREVLATKDIIKKAGQKNMPLHPSSGAFVTQRERNITNNLQTSPSVVFNSTFSFANTVSAPIITTTMPTYTGAFGGFGASTTEVYTVTTVPTAFPSGSNITASNAFGDFNVPNVSRSDSINSVPNGPSHKDKTKTPADFLISNFTQGNHSSNQVLFNPNSFPSNPLVNQFPQPQLNYTDIFKVYDATVNNLASLMTRLSEKLDNFNARSAASSFVDKPPIITIAPPFSAGSPVISTSDNWPQLNKSLPPFRQDSMSAPRRLKPLQVKDWNLTFSGDRRGKKARVFLKEVVRMSQMQGVSLNEVLWNMRFMLTGGALLWFDSHAEKLMNCTWEDFSLRFLNAFYDAESDFSIRKRIEERKQDQNENVEVFIAAMLCLFEELDTDLSEVEKVRLIRRNLHSSLRNALLLIDISTVNDLSEKLKLVERNRSYAYNERRSNEISSMSADIESSKVQSLSSRPGSVRTDSSPGGSPLVESSSGRDLNSAGPSQRNHTNNSNKICNFCKKDGHNIRSCMFRPRICCFKCCKAGVITRTCPDCNTSGNSATTQ